MTLTPGSCRSCHGGNSCLGVGAAACASVPCRGCSKGKSIARLGASPSAAHSPVKKNCFREKCFELMHNHNICLLLGASSEWTSLNLLSNTACVFTHVFPSERVGYLKGAIKSNKSSQQLSWQEGWLKNKTVRQALSF